MQLREEQALLNAFIGEKRDINPDYVGILQIPGTAIDYHVLCFYQ
jgi:hypothetical protein